MNQQPPPSRMPTDAPKTASRPRGLTTRLMLCVGLLGSVAAFVLRPHPVVTGIAVGIFVLCALTVILRALRRASRRIDRIVAEELTPPARERRQQDWRKSA